MGLAGTVDDAAREKCRRRVHEIRCLVPSTTDPNCCALLDAAHTGYRPPWGVWTGQKGAASDSGDSRGILPGSSHEVPRDGASGAVKPAQPTLPARPWISGNWRTKFHAVPSQEEKRKTLRPKRKKPGTPRPGSGRLSSTSYPLLPTPKQCMTVCVCCA